MNVVRVPAQQNEPPLTFIHLTNEIRGSRRIGVKKAVPDGFGGLRITAVDGGRYEIPKEMIVGREYAPKRELRLRHRLKLAAMTAICVFAFWSALAMVISRCFR